MSCGVKSSATSGCFVGDGFKSRPNTTSQRKTLKNYPNNAKSAALQNWLELGGIVQSFMVVCRMIKIMQKTRLDPR